MRGWQIASYPLPEDRRNTVVQRVLVRHGVTRDLVANLARDLREALAYLAHHPVAPTGEKRNSFHH